ncbi:cytochrome-c oxidase, cbb3-type subunit III [Roseitranquillus sediminis]|uniref:cytochrome-c oxidase, cbb3-type subunit III n=1 Tax=Roseitranquillus sediminis TaxID=2809051 RepID=UPI001D0C6C94|nr:cytochrome-c oxidase, cbb3-type subunit III [Roseitranquillus sediminis]MBM9594584.1 cytochrome-c oxidase, cbb3-type subunit III [Roseitranquillus sediminis]
MSVKERDPLTGHQTTGHEWNGITELNTRVPRAIWWFIGITHLWALVMWILLPTWPLVTSYTKGILGLDQRELVAGEIEAGERYREHWVVRFEGESLDGIRQDETLMEVVSGAAPAIWGDNCAVCHGVSGAGGPGFPNLVDDAWLWGGSDEAVLESIRVGINSAHPETQFSQMLAFGETDILTREQIRTVVAYVQSLSGLADPPPQMREEGAMLFADNCASCHGEDATGVNDLGAPNLTDDAWIYGGDTETLFVTIHDGRMGWMPGWEGRLTQAERKMLAVYLLDVLPEEGG